MLRTQQIDVVRRTLSSVRGHKYFSLMVLLLIVLSAIWGFAELADEVLEGDTQTFDEWAIRSLRQTDDPSVPIGPTWLHEAGRDVTAIGGMIVLVTITFFVAGYLLMLRKTHAMWLVLIATLGGIVISTVLKNLFDRDRPDIVPHLSIVHTPSFPSGHSMMSAVVYLTLGVLLARFVPDRRAKVYFIVIALMLTFAVGMSRVYMGVHYPTDVLAGWVAGLTWALICWVVARYLQIRGTVERDIDEPGGPEAARATEAKT